MRLQLKWCAKRSLQHLPGPFNQSMINVWYRLNTDSIRAVRRSAGRRFVARIRAAAGSHRRARAPRRATPAASHREAAHHRGEEPRRPICPIAPPPPQPAAPRTRAARHRRQRQRAAARAWWSPQPAAAASRRQRRALARAWRAWPPRGGRPCAGRHGAVRQHGGARVTAVRRGAARHARTRAGWMGCGVRRRRGAHGCSPRCAQSSSR